jgi:hypothetical protein
MLLGAQAPRICSSPTPPQFTDGADIAYLSGAYGLTPDEWQRYVIDRWSARRRDKRYIAGRCGLAVPRQNGKNGILEMVELFKIVVLGRRILHTAHEVKTARKAFLRLKSFFENERLHPELAAMVKEIRQTNGQEAIVLTNGGSVEFVARSRGSGRGYTVDDLVCDEAQELTDEQYEALLPTVSSAPSGDPQVILVGTPPGPGSPGTVFRRMRDAGVKGKDKRLAWVEWSADANDELDIHDRKIWAATNPALGGRLNERVVVDEVAGMTPEGFARERLGVWDDEAMHRKVIDLAAWSALASDSTIDGALALGIAMTPDRSTVTVGVAGFTGDKRLVRTGMSRRGTSWLVPWLEGAIAERSPVAVVLDAASAAGALIPELERAGIDLHIVNVSELSAATGLLIDLVSEGGVTHPLDDHHLDSAVGVAKLRALTRGGALWDDRGSDVTSPLQGVTLALAGLEAHGGIDYDITDSFG